MMRKMHNRRRRKNSERDYIDGLYRLDENQGIKAT